MIFSGFGRWTGMRFTAVRNYQVYLPKTSQKDEIFPGQLVLTIGNSGSKDLSEPITPDPANTRKALLAYRIQSVF